MLRHHDGIARLLLRNASASTGWIAFGPWLLPCAIGFSGVSARKREGDGATPAGLMPLRQILYRAGRVPRPRSQLPVRLIQPNDGWCDAGNDANYNRQVRLPYPASTEALWRDDALYDIIVVLGFNDKPRSRSRGSCIFMHIASPGLTPTQGCVALSRENLLRLIEAPVALRALDTRRCR